MELGALVCLPNGAPLCDRCPVAALCRGRAAGRAEQLPVKPAKKAKPVLPLTAVVVRGPEGALLQKRPDRGLLAKLWQPLLWEGTLSRAEVAQNLAALGLPVRRLAPLGEARHVFTHKIWQMQGWLAETDGTALPDRCVWASAEQLETLYSVPSAFAAFRTAMSGGAGWSALPGSGRSGARPTIESLRCPCAKRLRRNIPAEPFLYEKMHEAVRNAVPRAHLYCIRSAGRRDAAFPLALTLRPGRSGGRLPGRCSSSAWRGSWDPHRRAPA